MTRHNLLRLPCGVLPKIIEAVVFASYLAIGSCLAQEKPKNEVFPVYAYDTAGITLKGRLVERQVYGPPGYGETPTEDSRDFILILKLGRKISVKPSPTASATGSASLDSVENVREVQLFVSRIQKAEVHKLIGKDVIAVGTLNEAITASQYTKVWLDVKTIKPKK